VSRFGIPVAHNAEVLDLLRAGSDVVDFLGLSFHLDTGAVGDKVQAVQECLGLIETAWSVGLTPRVLNLGGGFRQVFTADGGAFEEYVQALKRGLTGQGGPLTWDGNTLGYRYEDGGMRGVPVFHKYANTVSGRDSLRELLTSPLSGHGGRTIAQVLRENMIETWLEPGKALVDQAGVTLARVEFVKEASDGSVLVNLDLSRDKIAPADQEVMLDPVVIFSPEHPAEVSTGRADRTGVFFAGNLCLERDMIFNHVTFLDRVPRPGDIVAFVNTAAYQMDLSASQALLHRQPRKIVITAEGMGFSSYPDDEAQEVPGCSTTTSLT
jgi:diaminopimelate decarboxylase